MHKKQKSLFDIPLSRDKFNGMATIMSDPLGSYTGRPVDPSETPVQDADDL